MFWYLLVRWTLWFTNVRGIVAAVEWLSTAIDSQQQQRLQYYKQPQAMASIKACAGWGGDKDKRAPKMVRHDRLEEEGAVDDIHVHVPYFTRAENERNVTAILAVFPNRSHKPVIDYCILRDMKRLSLCHEHAQTLYG